MLAVVDCVSVCVLRSGDAGVRGLCACVLGSGDAGGRGLCCVCAREWRHWDSRSWSVGGPATVPRRQRSGSAPRASPADVRDGSLALAVAGVPRACERAGSRVVAGSARSRA
jgi:hypothetical protein